MGAAQVVAVKGVEGFNRAAPVVGPTYVDATEAGRRIRRGARLWTVAAATLKGETYRFSQAVAAARGRRALARRLCPSFARR
jgi:phage terminase large subunit GpA-like protein